MNTVRTVRIVKSEKFSKYVGLHLLVEFWNVKAIENKKKLKKILTTAAKKSKNIPLKIVIHKFKPHGITGVVLLAESHLSVHSWPEIDYLAIDIFSCGQRTDPKKVIQYLKKQFQPKRVETKLVKRGFLKKKEK